MEGWLQRWQQPMPVTEAMAHEAEHAWGTRMLATQILTAQQNEVDQLTRWHDAWSCAAQPP
jgi:uncharacterized protein (DUF305 family)